MKTEKIKSGTRVLWNKSKGKKFQPNEGIKEQANDTENQ